MYIFYTYNLPFNMYLLLILPLIVLQHSVFIGQLAMTKSFDGRWSFICFMTGFISITGDFTGTYLFRLPQYTQYKLGKLF